MLLLNRHVAERQLACRNCQSRMILRDPIARPLSRAFRLAPVLNLRLAQKNGPSLWEASGTADDE